MQPGRVLSESLGINYSKPVAPNNRNGFSPFWRLQSAIKVSQGRSL